MTEFLMEVRNMMDQMVSGNEDALTAWVSHARAIKSVTRIPGDASTRRYYRVQSDKASFILMQMEGFEEQGLNLPFIEVQKHLQAAGVDVPAILDVEPARGFILLEDLGDITLLRKLQDVANPEVERHIYERVIDSLVEMQVLASPARRPAQIAGYSLRFDFEKLMWEVHFAIEHFYEKHLGRTISAADRKILEEGFSEICTILANEPVVFTHRDFHSRNVMTVPGQKAGDPERYAMIDFQDARMGPAQYDLASLLKDSYYQLEESQIDRLLDYAIARVEALSGSRLDRNHFRFIFDLMSVQRNFKAIGSFASFQNKRGNPTYLKYIGNTFENIRRTLLRHPRYAQLREVLFHYYYF